MRVSAHSPFTDRLMHITHQNKSWAQPTNSSLSEDTKVSISVEYSALFIRFKWTENLITMSKQMY